jgi:SAM-dependent methyltransferase
VGGLTATVAGESAPQALARFYDLDLAEDPGDVELYLALAARTGGPIVELGVGTGRVASPLAAAGHTVVGVDDDPAMLERARQRASRSGKGVADRLALVRADMAGVRRSDLGASLAADLEGGANLAADLEGGANLAFIALNSILLLSERDRQRRLLATMASLLRPGGLAVVDAWLPSIEDLVRFDGRVSLEWLRADPETGREVAKLASAWYDETKRVVTLTTIFDEAEPGGAPNRWTRSDALRLVTADELRAFAEDAGLRVEQVAGDYDLGPFGPGSERAILVAVKPG